MNMTTNQGDWNVDYTGYLFGRPIRVSQDDHIEISFGKMTTSEMVNSKEFQMLNRSFDVHRDWRDFH